MAQRGGGRLTPVGRADVKDNERVTVTLIPKAIDTLDRLVVETRMSKTDLVNRALILYGFVNDKLDDGLELHLHDPESGKSSQVQIL